MSKVKYILFRQNDIRTMKCVQITFYDEIFILNGWIHILSDYINIQSHYQQVFCLKSENRQTFTIYDQILRSTILLTSHDLMQDPNFNNLGLDSERSTSCWNEWFKKPERERERERERSSFFLLARRWTSYPASPGKILLTNFKKHSIGLACSYPKELWSYRAWSKLINIVA